MCRGEMQNIRSIRVEQIVKKENPRDINSKQPEEEERQEEGLIKCQRRQQFQQYLGDRIVKYI